MRYVFRTLFLIGGLSFSVLPSPSHACDPSKPLGQNGCPSDENQPFNQCCCCSTYFGFIKKCDCYDCSQCTYSATQGYYVKD